MTTSKWGCRVRMSEHESFQWYLKGLSVAREQGDRKNKLYYKFDYNVIIITNPCARILLLSILTQIN